MKLNYLKNESLLLNEVEVSCILKKYNNTNWTKDIDEIKKIFDDCFCYDPRRNDIDKKDELLELFTKKLQNISSTEKENIICACYIFDNPLKSFSRERFFEICFDNELLNINILTALYLTVHTTAKPYSWFTEEKMDNILQKLNTPIMCFEAKNKFSELNNIIEVFRGLQSQPIDIDKCGICWTTDIAIAKKFATLDCKINGYIVKGKVMKSDIKGLILSRDENEIIVNSKYVFDKQIVNICC